VTAAPGARFAAGDRLEGLRVLAAVLQRLAERVADRDAIGIGGVGARQRRLHALAVGRRQRLGLDVCEPAPGIAAGRLRLQHFAIGCRGLVEATQVHERVAEQHRRRPQLRRSALARCSARPRPAIRRATAGCGRG
jgi:hypothetical protein